MISPHHVDVWALKDGVFPSSVRQRPKGAPAEMLLKDVPSGRSWFYSIRVGDGCTLVEHRVPATITGRTAHTVQREYIHHHRDLTHAEATRLKRALCGQGLFYAGGPL